MIGFKYVRVINVCLFIIFFTTQFGYASYVDLPITVNKEESLLHMAVRMGDADKTMLLIKKGKNVNIQDRYGNTPLMKLVDKIHDPCFYYSLRDTDELSEEIKNIKKVVRVLIQHGANFDIKNNRNECCVNIKWPDNYQMNEEAEELSIFLRDTRKKHVTQLDFIQKYLLQKEYKLGKDIAKTIVDFIR